MVEILVADISMFMQQAPSGPLYLTILHFLPHSGSFWARKRAKYFGPRIFQAKSAANYDLRVIDKRGGTVGKVWIESFFY